MTTPQPITITLDRRLLEHPQALHLRRMRTALFLYLDLLARIPADAEQMELKPAVIAADMGLPEGTVRSWLGHLRHSRYIGLRRLNGSVIVSIVRKQQRAATSDAPHEEVREDHHLFTLARVQRTLGEHGNDEQLAAALGEYAPLVIQRALAGALAPPASEIRRSRTALFLFLLKRYGQKTHHHPRP